MAEKACSLGIDILALTDHNSAMNCPAFADACIRSGITGIFGLEISSMEEIHLLALFPTPEAAEEMGAWVSTHYMGFDNNPEKMGDQVYLDKEENILGEVKINLAQGASTCSMEQIELEIHNREGLFIPAHIDRPSFSLISQLGFIPEGHYDALECVDRTSFNSLDYPVITGSDAHYIQDMGKRAFPLDSPGKDFKSLAYALKNKR